MLSFIQTFGLLLLIITAISFFIKLLKQPIIIGYVLSGIVFSLFFLSQSGMAEQVEIFSEIGITFLLFLMGLEFDLSSLKYLGKDILLATLLQSVIFFGAAFGLSSFFSFSIIERVYIGILFMFSSTLLVAKWIADKKETSSLHGKITLGILVIQDILAIILLTVLDVVKESSLTRIVTIPLYGLLLVAIAFLLSKYVLNLPLKKASKYPELLFLLSLSVCFAFVELAPLLGYSTTIGAFIGGVVLANTAYRIEISARLKPLIVFFNMLFFVGLGFQIKFDFGMSMIIFLALLCVLNFILKPVVAYLTLRMRGYDLKTSFFSGLYLSQLSEFGIIIIAGGMASGNLTPEAGTLAIISVIATMVLSSYLIKYDRKIFKLFESRIVSFDKKFITKDIKEESVDIDCNILFFRYCDVDKEILSKFKKMGKRMIVIDNDPQNIELMKKEGIEYIYNSISNPEFFEHLNFEKVDLVVSSLTDIDENKMIIHEIKKTNPKAVIIATAKSLKDSMELYRLNVDYVLYSAFLKEQKVSVLLEEYSADINKLLEKKISDMSRFKEKEARMADVSSGEFLDIESFIRKARKAGEQSPAGGGRQKGKAPDQPSSRKPSGKPSHAKDDAAGEESDYSSSDKVKKPDNMML